MCQGTQVRARQRTPALRMPAGLRLGHPLRRPAPSRRLSRTAPPVFPYERKGYGSPARGPGRHRREGLCLSCCTRVNACNCCHAGRSEAKIRHPYPLEPVLNDGPRDRHLAASAQNEEHEANPCIPPTTARGYRSRLGGRENTMGRGSAPSGGALFQFKCPDKWLPLPSCRTGHSGDPVSRAEITGAHAGHSGYRIALRLCGMTAEGAAVLKKTYPPPSNLLHTNPQAHAYGQLGERPSDWCGLDGATG